MTKYISIISLALSVLFSLMPPTQSASAEESWERGERASVLIKDGAVRLTAAEVRALIVGKTEAWRHDNSGVNAAYYAPNGVLEVRNLGRKNTETWVIKPDGSVCYSECHYYLRYKGKVVMVWNRKTTGVKRYWPGRHLW